MGDLKVVGTNASLYSLNNKVEKEKVAGAKKLETDQLINATGTLTVADIQGAQKHYDIYIAIKEGNKDVIKKIDLKSNPEFLNNLIKEVQANPNFKLDASNFLNPPPPPTPVSKADGSTIKTSLGTDDFKKILAAPTQDAMLKSDFGKNILLQTGIKDSDAIKTMTPEEKGSVAFNFGLVALRDDILTQKTDSALFKQLKQEYPNISDTDLMIMIDPDKEVGIKSRKISPDAKKILQSPEFQMSITNAIYDKSAPFYQALGGPDPMPKQYLAATGNGNKTQGIAFSDVNDSGVGSGFFMFDFNSKTNSQVNTTPDAGGFNPVSMKTDSMLTNKNLSVTFPANDDLRVKLSTYGSETGATGQNQLTLKIGEIEIKGVIKNNAISLTPPLTDKAFTDYCTSQNLSYDESAYKQFLKEEKGIEIDDRQNITFKKEKFPTQPNLSIQYQCQSSVGVYNDETQLQISCNSSISNGAKVKADGLFGTDLFKADKSLLKTEDEIQNFTDLANTIPNYLIADIKSGAPVNLTNFFDLTGGGVNDTDPSFPKDATSKDPNISKTYDKMRSSYAEPGTTDKGESTIKIHSYTDPRGTHLADGMASIPSDKRKILTAAFADKGIGLNNDSLSALRTASFAKALLLEKDPTLKNSDFSKVTVDVKVDGKVVTLCMADIPPY